MSAPAIVAVVPVRAVREAWRAVRDALPALGDVPWPLVDAAVMGGSEATDLVERCTDGDALVVCGLRAVSWRWRYGVTVDGLAAGPMREALVDALVALGAEVQP